MVRLRRIVRRLRRHLPPAALGVLLLVAAVVPVETSRSALTAAACLWSDRNRDHNPLQPPSGMTPPPSGGDRPELAEPTWVSWAWPMTVDFTAAVLLDNEELARGFVTPGYDLDIPALRCRLGIGCNPDFFTVDWGAVAANRAVVEPTLYYPGYRVTFQVVFWPYPDGWRIVAVEPRRD